MVPSASTTESLISATSHLNRGTSNLYNTVGETIGDGDFESELRSTPRLSGEELKISVGGILCYPDRPKWYITQNATSHYYAGESLNKFF